MSAASHTIVSIGASVCSGCAFAVAAASAFPESLLLLPYVFAFGGVIGLVLSPAAIFARAVERCRPSFAWVFVPTAMTAFAGSLVGGPSLAIISSAGAYVGTSVAVGVVALRRRRRLYWYDQGCCSLCGYDMSGLATDRCPECGQNGRVRPWMRVPASVLRP